MGDTDIVLDSIENFLTGRVTGTTAGWEGARQGATARVDAALGWAKPGWEVCGSGTQIGREKPKTTGDSRT